MARIPRLHHNNFKQRTPNYSYMEADALYVSGQSISSTVLYGPPIAVHSSRCPTVTQEKPVVDTKSLKINNETRRPFFEDQYSWVKGPYEASGYHLAKYFGSGTIASDEVRAYVSGSRGSGKILFQDSSLSGQYYSQVTNWDADYKSWISQYEKDTFGIKDSTVGNNIVMTAGLFGHLIDRWVCKVRETDEDYESVVIVGDGVGFGRQNFGDGQYKSPIWGASTAGWKPPSGYDGIPSYDDYPLFSGVRFIPPLPKSYLNPITTPGAGAYYEFNGRASGNIMYPEEHFERAHTNANVIYSKRTPEANKLTIESAYVPSDFGAELRGGDTTSAVSPWGPWYWDQYKNEVVNPTSGFIETSVNALERGYIPGISVQEQAYLRYKKTIVNFGGEGVHREVYGVYKNHDWDYKNYLGSKAFDRISGSAIPESVGNAYIKYFGELARPPGSSHEYHMNEIIGAASMDNRFDEMHMYSPETKKTVTFSQVSAATVKVGGVTTALETPRYFKAIMDIAAPGNVSRTFMNMSFLDDSSASATSPFNKITLTSNEGSGTGNSPVDAVYSKSFSPSDPEWLGSNQVFAIQERTADNPGGLSTAAIGHFGILNSGQSNNITKNGWLAPGACGMWVNPGTTSGILGQPDYGNAFDYLWTSSIWGTGPRGDGYQDRRSLPSGGMQFTNGSTSYSPKGWNLMHELVIVGTSKDDVISKLHTFLDNNTWNKFIYPEDELPDVVLNYQSPLKAGRIH